MRLMGKDWENNTIHAHLCLFLFKAILRIEVYKALND